MGLPPFWRTRRSCADLQVSDRAAIAQIIVAYDVMLGRPVDKAGLRFYVERLRRGTTLAEIVRQILVSDEFAARLPSGAAKQSFQCAGLKRDSLEEAVEGRGASEIIAKFIEASAHARNMPLLPHLGEPAHDLNHAPTYRWWVSDFERLILAREPWLGEIPSFVLLMFVPRSASQFFAQAVSSVMAQTYRAFELVLLISNKNRRRVDAALAALGNDCERLRPRYIDMEASRNAETLAALCSSGAQYVGLVGAHDLMAPNALAEVAHAIECAPTTEAVFTDEDAIGSDGLRHSPVFKTAWDPDRLLAGHDIGSFAVFRRDLVEELQGWRDDLGGLEGWDFSLRAMSRLCAANTKHVPLVLYHKRDPRTPFRHPRRYGNEVAELAQRARVITSCMNARGKTVLCNGNERRLRVVYPLAREKPFVSIIIPTRDRVDLLKHCVTGLMESTSYEPMQIVLVDNDSEDPETGRYLSHLSKDPRILVAPCPGDFNWGAANNFGVAASKGELLLLLNNDVEVIHADWLDELASQAMREDVGVVGAKLLYPDGRLQHGGMILTSNGACIHAARFANRDEPGYLSILQTVRTVSAVTGACIATRRHIFEEVGGIEQNRLRVTCSDVDFCLRVSERGYRVIWTPHAELYHRELSTRGSDETPDKARRARCEQEYLAQKWRHRLESDPFWSPSLELSEAVAHLSVPPRWKQLRPEHATR